MKSETKDTVLHVYPPKWMRSDAEAQVVEMTLMETCEKYNYDESQTSLSGNSSS